MPTVRTTIAAAGSHRRYHHQYRRCIHTRYITSPTSWSARGPGAGRRTQLESAIVPWLARSDRRCHRSSPASIAGPVGPSAACRRDFTVPSGYRGSRASQRSIGPRGGATRGSSAYRSRACGVPPSTRPLLPGRPTARRSARTDPALGDLTNPTTPARSMRHPCRVDRHAPQPRVEPIRAAYGANLPPRRDERVLGGVARIGLVAEDRDASRYTPSIRTRTISSNASRLPLRARSTSDGLSRERSAPPAARSII